MFSLYGVLTPLVNNIYQLGESAIRSLLASIAMTVLITVVFRRLARDPVKGGLLSTGAILLYFTYGHVTLLLSGAWPGSRFWHTVMLVLWLALFLVWARWIFRHPTSPVFLSNYLNVVGWIVVAFPIFQVLTYGSLPAATQKSLKEYHNEVMAAEGLSALQLKTERLNQPLRDIYLIVLDSYTRADVMEKFYGFDNRPFLQALQERGFYVAESSNANYNKTVFTLASELNMSYLTGLPEHLSPIASANDGTLVYQAAINQFTENEVFRLFREAGYTLTAFDTGDTSTNFTSADVYVSPPGTKAKDLEEAVNQLMLNSAIGQRLPGKARRDAELLEQYFDDRRSHVLYALDHMADKAGSPGPNLVFVHVLCPHSPYVFGPDGEERMGLDPFNPVIGLARDGWRPEYYSDQVAYLNKRVLTAIDEIRAKSRVEPIIILQGDHSNRSYEGPGVPDEETYAMSQYPILNAYFFPGVDASQSLYPTISPVNSFRVVMNDYFGGNLALQGDVAYEFQENVPQSRFVPYCDDHACNALTLQSE